MIGLRTVPVRCRLSNVGSILVSGLAALVPAVASAQTIGDAGVIASNVCANVLGARDHADPSDITNTDGVWRAVTVDIVAYFIETSIGKVATPESALREVTALRSQHYHGEGTSLWDTVYTFQADILAGRVDGARAFRTGDNEALSAASVKDDERPWLFDQGFLLRCKVPNSASGKTDAGQETPHQPWKVKPVLRGTTDALTATGKERLSADAATFTYSRLRAYQSDGTRKQTDTYAIKAVFGVPLLPDADLQGLIGYGSYELKRDRANPPPNLTPPATERDGDTEIVKVGLIGHKLFDISPRQDYSTSLDVKLDSAYLFDVVKDAERARLRLTVGVYNFTGIWFCGIGDYKSFRGSKLATRCDVTAEADINRLTKAGKISPNGKDSFSHVGGKASFRALLSGSILEGPFATAEWTYLRRVDGNPAAVPHINQHKFNLGYRWWHNDAFGIEVKAELVDGINPDSLEDENNLSLGFGLIF